CRRPGTGRPCARGACRRWGSGSARAPGPDGRRRRDGGRSLLDSRAVAGDEPLGHLLVPPDAVELEVLAAVVEHPVVHSWFEERDIPGAERCPLPGTPDHRLAAETDEDLVLVVRVQGRMGAGPDHRE